jgi:hypothetical protein
MNMAFRTADYLQNSRLPFVTGVTVELSASHPENDICDELAGVYPRGFQFTGWHPMCICFATYDTMPKEDFVKYLQTGEVNTAQRVADIPDHMSSWMMKNAEKIGRMKHKPYFVADNFTRDLTLRKSVLR